MSNYRFTHNGTPFEADTAQGLKELYEMIVLMRPTPVKPPSATAPKSKPPAAPVDDDRIPLSAFPEWAPKATLDFLRAIVAAPPDGADSEMMKRALGVTEPKALGGRSAVINRLIESTGFRLHQVYDNTRTAKGRFWKSRKAIDDVIAEIERRIAEEG